MDTSTNNAEKPSKGMFQLANFINKLPNRELNISFLSMNKLLLKKNDGTTKTYDLTHYHFFIEENILNLLREDYLNNIISIENVLDTFKIEFEQKLINMSPVIKQIYKSAKEENVIYFSTMNQQNYSLKSEHPEIDLDAYEGLKHDFGFVSKYLLSKYRKLEIIPIQFFNNYQLNNHLTEIEQEQYNNFKTYMNELIVNEKYMNDPVLKNLIVMFSQVNKKTEDKQIQDDFLHINPNLARSAFPSPETLTDVERIDANYKAMAQTIPLETENFDQPEDKQSIQNEDSLVKKRVLTKDSDDAPKTYVAPVIPKEKSGAIDIFSVLATLIILGIIVIAVLIYMQY